MPRLLHVLSHLDPDGASTQVRLLASKAVARGEAVAVASLRRPGAVGEALRDAGVPVTWLQQRFTVDPFAARNLRRLVAAWRPDAVQSWDEASAAFCRRATVPWVHTVRNSEPPPKGLHAAAGVVASDEAAAARVRAECLSDSVVTVVPNTFDPTIQPADAAAKHAARQRLRTAGVEVDDTTPLVISVARLDDPARIKEIAWASDLVRVVCPGLRLLVVGDGPARMACERFAAAATEPGTVVWLGDVSEFATCLAAADVVWCASDGSMAPTPAIEAMAAGKPLVLADGPGRDTLLPDPADNRPCCRVRWNDRAGWARAAKRLIADRDLAVQIGQDNARRVRLGHTLPTVAAAHAEAISRAVADDSLSSAS